jgi:hypothetical protein
MLLRVTWHDPAIQAESKAILFVADLAGRQDPARIAWGHGHGCHVDVAMVKASFQLIFGAMLRTNHRLRDAL